MTLSRAALRRILHERSRAIVEGWYKAVQSCAVALHSPSELHSYLSDIWDQVVAFLLLEDGQPCDAEPIGASFVPLRVKPQAVGRIQRVLFTCLLEDLSGEEARHSAELGSAWRAALRTPLTEAPTWRAEEIERVIWARLPNLVAGLTAGLVNADRRTLLNQQEEIREAYARSLRRAEEQLRIKNAGIEDSINAVMMLDLEGGITYVNPAFLEMWGYEDDCTVLGRHVSGFGEWQGDVRRGLMVLSEQGGWVGELVAVRRDGSRFDVQASVSPIRDGSGRHTQLMVFFVDITERKKTQEALRQRAVQAAFLNEIGEEIAGERTAHRVLERAVQLARETFDFHQVAVLLLNRGRQTLDVAAVASPVDDLTRDVCSISLGEGITGWVAQQNRTAVVNDVSADPRYLRLFSTPLATRSELATPIRVRGHVVGVLDVQSPTRDAFGKSEQVVLETLADQVAVALENARLYQALQEELAQREEAEQALRRSVRRLETVHEIDQAIVGARSTEEIADVVIRHLRHLVPCQRASIILFDWACDQVTVLAATQTVGEGRAGAGTRFPITQKEWLLDLWESGELAGIRDARGLPRSSPLVRTVVDDGIRSFLSAPIGFRGELMGLLSLGLDQLDGFEPGHMPIVEELADTVAIAIQQARLFDSVGQHRERLRRTMARLAEVEEKERRRVVRELHDRVGQNLTALDLNLSLVQSQLEEQGLEQLGERLVDSLSLVARTNQTIRQLMIDLRPPVLDDYGLMSALHWYGDRFSNRTGIAVAVKGKDEFTHGLSSHVENALFRIAQEALNNIAKHARATDVTIASTADEGVFQLTIEDNGMGFEPEDAEDERSSWGLLTMRERAESVGAWCHFDSTPGEGTCVLVEVPKERD